MNTIYLFTMYEFSNFSQQYFVIAHIQILAPKAKPWAVAF